MIEMSMNETPYPPLPGVEHAVADAALNRYPDPTAGALVAALAARRGVAPEQVLVGPGSAGLLQHLLTAFGPARPEVVHAALSFEAYPLLAANAGARPVPVPMDGHRHDLSAMAAAVGERTRCVLVCSPNNPTGAVVGRREMCEFLNRVPPDVPVFLDEAYREFVTDPDAVDGVDLLGDHPNLVVLRTFSKAYGLAALRVGYAFAAPALAGRARSTGAVFFPGTPGQAAALASLEPAAEAELVARCADLATQRARLSAGLRAAGLPVAPSEGNFLWLDLAERADAFAGACRAAGILVRAYPGRGVRVTVGAAADNDRLLGVAGPLWRVAACGH
jgi:histidinol-phosphate aminotransferase